MPEDPLDIQDYLDASSDASKRTRTITIILVVASVLVLAGLLNSLQSQWMRLRLESLQNIHGKYTEAKLGPFPQPKDGQDEKTYDKAVATYEQSHKDLINAVTRAYVENAMVIRVPFFGFTFDVNDLGLLGGLGFLIILGCYRFCISRESDNLRLSFEEANKLGRQQEFYNLLAMRQVFTVPRSKFITRTRFLVITPRLICWLPLAVHLLVTGHDFWTAWIGEQLGKWRYQLLIGSEVVIAFFLLLLSISVTRRLVRIDQMWNHYHKRNLRRWRARLKVQHNKSFEPTAS